MLHATPLRAIPLSTDIGLLLTAVLPIIVGILVLIVIIRIGFRR